MTSFAVIVFKALGELLSKREFSILESARKLLDEKATGIAWSYGVTIFMLSETRSYRPDFTLADGSIIEVKGYWRAKNKLKFEEWVQKYPHIKYEIWDKAKLKSLGLL